MIFTVTLNPALDYVIKVEEFVSGKVNRAAEEHIFYGGKGLNVSRVLKTLGHESVALGFVAGFTGKEIERGMKSFGVMTDFVSVKSGMSRINVKLKSGEESEINGVGPTIGEEDETAFFKKLEGLKEGDVLVLSGSIPKSMEKDTYERILRQVEERKVLTVVDGEKGLLISVLKYHPFLIKPNQYELGELFDTTVAEEKEVLHYAAKLQDMGARNVLISMGEKGSILLGETKEVYKRDAAKGIVKNSVGAGDSMVAGFLAGYLERGDFGYGLKLGTAAGGATAFSDDLGDGELIKAVFQSL